MTRNDRIRSLLNDLVTEGVISDYYTQTNMPGRRWTLLSSSVGGTFTTNEVEAFIRGAKAVLFRPAA